MMLVSVIVPSYNHKQYVLQAIESVLNQNWSEIDLIVIDDGSTDGSADLIEEHHRRVGGYRFVRRENRGFINTLNEGVEKSKGELLCLLASDDYLPEESISCRAQMLKNNPDCVAVFADGVEVNGDSSAGIRMMDEKRAQLFRVSDPIPYFLKGVNLFIHTMMVRKRDFLEIGGFDKRYRHCEDLDVQLLLFLHGEVKYIDRPVYCYRRHESNVSSYGSQIARGDKVRCYRKYLEEVVALRPYRKLISMRLRRQYLLLGRYLMKTGGRAAHERELFEGGWEFAWRDVRLFFLLVFWQWKKKSFQD